MIPQSISTDVADEATEIKTLAEMLRFTIVNQCSLSDAPAEGLSCNLEAVVTVWEREQLDRITAVRSSLLNQVAA